jgi:hypothetical protein
MDPCHESDAANAPTLTLVPQSALVANAISTLTALEMQDDSLDKRTCTSLDASKSTHVNDSATLVWFTRLHGVLDANL